MTENSEFRIRPMTMGDLGQALNLSVSEGWNQTKKDWKLLLENPFNTCIVAESSGKVIGTATAMNYSDKSFSFMGGNDKWGYIFGRNGTRFNYAGPLCADSEESARALLSIALKSLQNKPVVLDIPEDKEDLIRWLESLGFEKQRHFVRMYLGKNPYPGEIKSQYLISGPEFG